MIATLRKLVAVVPREGEKKSSYCICYSRIVIERICQDGWEDWYGEEVIKTLFELCKYLRSSEKKIVCERSFDRGEFFSVISRMISGNHKHMGLGACFLYPRIVLMGYLNGIEKIEWDF